MRDIAHKPSTLRIAVAEARVHMKGESLAVVRDNLGPKPDILPTARAAAFLAIKNTHMAIPLCHPLPVEAVTVHFEFEEKSIRIEVEAKTIYKTGCEIEAMHGAAVAALTIYDMMKPVDKAIKIGDIRLLRKSGGKTDWKEDFGRVLSAAVVVCSDSVSAGKKEDRSGKIIRNKLEELGLNVVLYQVVPDNPAAISALVQQQIAQQTDLIITTGGTGLSPTDITTETLRVLIDREVPGIAEAARSYGQQRTPYAMLSRSIAGLSDRSLILGLPGSTGGASETMDALFPAVLHTFKVLEKGFRHQKNQSKQDT